MAQVNNSQQASFKASDNPMRSSASHDLLGGLSRTVSSKIASSTAGAKTAAVKATPTVNTDAVHMAHNPMARQNVNKVV